MFLFSLTQHAAERRLGNVGSAVATIVKQVAVDAKRDRHRGMAETATDRYRVHACRDNLVGVSMAQAMQRDLGQLELGQGSRPLLVVNTRLSSPVAIASRNPQRCKLRRKAEKHQA